jgi:hypothetical protein
MLKKPCNINAIWKINGGESFRSIARSVGFSVATVQDVLKSAPAMDTGEVKACG